MRYLNGYKIFESKQDIDSICAKYKIINYTINQNGLIDVDGGVDLSNLDLDRLPIKFGNVTSHFNCCENNLIDLEGCPEEVGGNFYCGYNKLETLEYVPDRINRSFYCSRNNLKSLEGCPTFIGGAINCNDNQLYSLEHFPKHIGDHFMCRGNPIHSLVKNFVRKSNACNLVELFNDADIVQGDKVIWDRLLWFYEEVDVRLVSNTEEIESYYKIIK